MEPHVVSDTPLASKDTPIEMPWQHLRCRVCQITLYQVQDVIWEHPTVFDHADPRWPRVIACPNEGKKWRVTAIPIVAEEIG